MVCKLAKCPYTYSFTSEWRRANVACVKMQINSTEGSTNPIAVDLLINRKPLFSNSNAMGLTRLGDQVKGKLLYKFHTCSYLFYFYVIDAPSGEGVTLSPVTLNGNVCINSLSWAKYFRTCLNLELNPMCFVKAIFDILYVELLEQAKNSPVSFCCQEDFGVKWVVIFPFLLVICWTTYQDVVSYYLQQTWLCFIGFLCD